MKIRQWIHESVYLTALLALAFAFLFALFWPTKQLVMTPDFGRIDAWDLSFSEKYLLGRALHQNQLPIWEPTIGSGFPLLSEGQVGTFFIPNLILFRLLDAVSAYNLALLVAVFLFGGGGYVWFRLHAIPNILSFFGGAILSLSGIVIPHLTHITLLQGLSLMPWIMAITHLVIQKPTTVRITLLAAVISQQLMAGFPQATWISLLFAGSYCLFMVWRRADWTKISFSLILALTTGVGLSAVQILPSAEFLSQSTHPGGFPLSIATAFSFPPKHLLTLLDPFLFGNPKNATYPPFTQFNGSIFWENSGFVGIVTLLFAILFFVRKKDSDDRVYWFVTASLIGSLLLMLGTASPLYLVHSFWPFSLFRVPSRYVWIWVMTIVFACMRTTSALWIQKRHQLTVRLLMISAFIATLINLFATWRPYHALVEASNWLTPPTLSEFVSTNDRIITIGSEMLHNKSFLSQGWKSMDPYILGKNTLTANGSSLWGISQKGVFTGRQNHRMSTIDSLLTSHIRIDDREATISASAIKLLQMSGVTRVITTSPTQNSSLKQKVQLKKNDIDIRLYRFDPALPRIRLVYETLTASSVQDVAAILQSSDFDPAKQAIVENSISVTNASGQGSVTLVEEGKTNMTIRIQANPSDALLVVSDTYYPGWEATVDGMLTPIYPVNVASRGVLVPKGDHEISLTYQPKSLQIGAWISAATFFLITVLTGFPIAFSTLKSLKISVWRQAHRLRNR